MHGLSETVQGMRCTWCGEERSPTLTPPACPACGHMFEPVLDLDAVTIEPADIDRRRFDSLWRYQELLPFDAEHAVSLGEGATPLLEAPSLATKWDVANVYVKLEGANPTGTFKDRGQTMAMTAANAANATAVGLASAGNAGHSAAAYAARAGLDAHIFLPARAGFTQKALVNVHGANLRVIEGKLPDAGEAFAEALAEHDAWFSLSTGHTPFRREGKKTMFFELAEQLAWESPDAIVYPTGGGVGLLGMAKGVRELIELGWIASEPAFYAAQAAGCAPIVDAFDQGATEIEGIEYPDTICGGIEVPAPSAAKEILQLLRESEGGAVATSDEAILDGALALASDDGIGIAPTAAAAVSAGEKLASADAFTKDETIVLLATGTALKDPDILRSQLMSKGV